MGQQMADAHRRPVAPSWSHTKRLEMLVDRIIQLESALLMELHQPDGGQGLRYRRDLEDGVWIDRTPRYIGCAEAMAVDEVLTPYHPDGQSSQGMSVGGR